MPAVSPFHTHRIKYHFFHSGRALERLHAEGKARSIGVSNFTVAHLDALLPQCAVRPRVNQVELHPLCPQRELLAYCDAHQIQVQAYSSLGQEKGQVALLQNATVVDVAARLGRTPAQVLLRYAVQQRIPVIPKSSSRAHLDENSRIFDFELSACDMEVLHVLGGVDAPAQHFCWDPTNVL